MKDEIPYIAAITSISLVAILAVALIIIFRPDQDNTAIIASVFGFLTPTLFSLLAFLKAQQTHLSVNSRLTEFIKNAEKAAHSDGELQGRDKANARTDELNSPK